MLEIGLIVRSQRLPGDVWRVDVAGEIDLYSVVELQRALEAISPEAARVVFDLREVTFIDSTGLAALLAAARRLLDPAALELRVGNPCVERALGVSGLDRRFEIVRA